MKNSNLIQTANVADLCYPVEIVPFNGAANSEYSNDIFVYPDGKNNGGIRVNSCSDRYELVPVSTFAPEIEGVVSAAGLKYTATYRNYRNAVFYGELVIEDERFYIGKPEDTLKMRIYWSHSYNGLETYELNMGTFMRKLCTNGLWITTYSTKEYGLAIVGKHTEKILKSLTFLRNKLQTVLNSDVMLKASQLYMPLYDNWVNNWSDRLLDVMAVAGIGETKNNVETLQSIVLSEAAQLNYSGVNDWLLYNSVNQFLFNPDNYSALDSAQRAKDQKVLTALLTDKVPARPKEKNVLVAN